MALAQRIYPESVPPQTEDEYEEEEEEEMPIVKAGKGRKAKPVARVRKLKPKRAPIELLPGWEGCHEKYRENTFGFIKNKIVKAMSDQRLRRGVPPGDSAEEAEEYSLDASDREFLFLVYWSILTRSCCSSCS
jgi:DNA-directed RNA polymerase III subunit RPC1